MPALIVVLRSDGTIVHVSDPKRHGWLERPCSEVAGDPELRAAAARLSEQESHSTAIEEVHTQEGRVLLVRSDGIPLRRSVVRVGELVMRTMDVFVGQARGAAVELRVREQPDMPPTIHADGEKVAWVLATLVGNAIRLVRRADEGAAPLVELSVRYDAVLDHFEFEVSDNGPGMPESTAAWLFRRDPRTGRAVGVALLMVKDIAAAHGGSVRVESSLGKGARFAVTIPRGARSH